MAALTIDWVGRRVGGSNSSLCYQVSLSRDTHTHHTDIFLFVQDDRWLERGVLCMMVDGRNVVD